MGISPGEEERGTLQKTRPDEPHGDAEHSPTDDEYACRDQRVKRSVQHEEKSPRYRGCGPSVPEGVI